MEDFWAGTLWVLKIWLCLIIGLIMMPAMFGFSLGISETYMTILIQTLEVLLFYIVMFLADAHVSSYARYSDSHPLVHITLGHECLPSVLLYSGPL